MIKIDGQELKNGTLRRDGKLIAIHIDLADQPKQLFRADTCVLEEDNEIYNCSVAESYVKAKYGKPKQRVLILRVISKLERAVESRSKVTKSFKKEVAKFNEDHREVLKELDDKPKPKKLKKIKKSKPKKKDS